MAKEEPSEFCKICKITTCLLFSQEDTDGDYQKALLYLCGGND